MPTIAAFLPVKGKSDRLKNKNIKLLDGKPLFLHMLGKLLSCEFIHEVYLDTESDEIIEMASEYPCKILKRDPKYATNSTDGNQLFVNEISHVHADIYIQVLCTSPFLSKKTIRNAILALENNTAYDSAILVRREKRYLWDNNTPLYNIEKIPNSVDLPHTTYETMGLYVVRRDSVLKTHRRIGENPCLLEASPLDAIDVNWPEDFELAELIASGLREKERKHLWNIKNYLSSPILSDILDDLGYKNQVIRKLEPNIKNVKLLGRAKTLELRKLEEGEDLTGIYHAIDTYDYIVPNDIIIVDNQVGNYAYFGELNANLAIRSGAAGAIIHGKTRDSAEVSNLGFPVFSEGFTCQDVKGRATVKSYNKTISIDEVTIYPESLVFADNEGIVIIPKNVESLVLKTAHEKVLNERKIILEMSSGKSTDSIIDDFGYF